MPLKRIIKDAAFLNAGLVPPVIQEMTKTFADLFAIDIADILRTNLPDNKGTDPDTGEEYESPALGYDETGLFQIDADPATLGSLVLVVTYGPETEFVQPVADEPPLAIPTAVYLLNLPNDRDLFTNTKLTEAKDELVKRHLIAAARKIVRQDATGEAPLVVDRIAALLTVTGKGGANKLEQAFNVMFKAIQHVVLGQARNLSKRLRDQQQFAKARDIDHVFTASRFNKATVKACFQSKAAAEHHFPNLPQAQWENLLRMATQAAPKFAPPMPVRDEDGKILKDAEGKTLIAVKQLPQSPAIFQQWLATRDSVAFNPPTTDDAAPITFDGLSIN